MAQDPNSADRAAAPEDRTGLLSVRKIWDAAPHNAFTDLTRYHGQLVCAFREAEAHVSPTVNGKLRVLSSTDGDTWTPAALLADPRGDLRDAKLSQLPDGRLVLLTAVHVRGRTSPPEYQSVAFYTDDLKTWTGPIDVGEPGVWLWGVRWHNGIGLSLGYGAQKDNRFVRLYRTADGVKFEPIVPKLDVAAPYPNENAIAFDPNGTANLLLRCDPDAAYFGTAEPPYTDWHLKQTNTRIGGPALLRLPDGRLLGAGRLYDPPVRTSLFWIDPVTADVKEWLPLPSGGDTSYPGLILENGVLNVSYYSSHEGKTSIYFARVRVPDPAK